MVKHSRNMLWSLAWIWLVVLFCNVAQAAAPDWQVITYPIYTGVWARVKINGVSIRSAGSKLAAFYGDELRGVAVIHGDKAEDNIDGEYYFNLQFGANESGEKGFTFKLWNSADDKIYDIDKTLDFDTNYPQKPDIYGGIVGGRFAPCIMNASISDDKYTLKISGGTINGGTASSAKFAPGEEVTIAATLPTNQGLKRWTASKDVSFIGSVLGATTTIIMPSYDVTITASFINKSEMQAVAVRSTTNSGDDTAKEPSSSTGTADKGKFTFTRTSSSGSLTVYFSIRGTATNGTDYKQITSNITFANGSTSVTREIEPLYDGVTEGDETVQVVLVPPSSTQTYRGGAVTDATVTIKDSQPVSNPTVKYTLSPAAAVTAGAKWKIDSGSWNNSGDTVTSTVGSHTISFKEVTGYTTPASQSITLKSGDAKTGTAAYTVFNGKYTLTVKNGTINGTSASTAQFAAGEEITIAATLPANQGLKIWTPSKDVEFIGSKLGATTTIKMPAYDVTVTASFVNKSDMQAVAVRSTTNSGDDTAQEPSSSTGTADKGKFTFTRTSSSGSLTVYFSIRGTATNGTDYKQITSNITFANGSTSVTREIEPLYDGVTEGNETVTVVLVPPSSTQTYRGGAVTEATVTIKDSVPVSNPTVKYTLSPAAAVTAGAKWKIDSGDWNASGATVTSTVGSHTISFKDVTGYKTPDSQTITLKSGDAKTGTAAYTVSDGKYTLTVKNGTINGTTSSSAKFSPGEEVTIAATLPANQGLKIWTPSKDVEFIGSKLGATTTIKMPAYDVTVTASFVNKSDMQAVAVRSTTNSGDDTAQEPSSSTGTADKGKFTFTRTSSSGSLTVYFSIRGTATNGTDYKQITSNITFANGSTSVTREIEPLYDGVTEGNETVTVVLIPPSSTQTYRGGAVTDATVTIKDSVPVSNPTVKYTLSPAAAVTAGAKWKIDSGDWNASGDTVTTTVGTHIIYFKDVTGYTAPASQTITLKSGDAKTGTAAYTVFDGKYTLTVSGGKINGTATTGKFSPGEKVSITATLPTNQGLKIWTPSKDVEFLGSRLAGTTTIVMPAYDVTVTASFVTKSDMPAVSVRSTTNSGDDTAQEPSSSTVSATDKGKFTFTRTNVNVAKALTVYYSIRGTATKGTDYKTIPSSVTFAANSTSVSVDIEPLYDGVTEGDETVEVVLIPPSSTQTYRGGTYTDATVTIKDSQDLYYHPADCMAQDYVISGLEYLQYAGPVKTAALGNYEYDWNGTDVLSLVRKATRGDEAPQTRAANDIAITRKVSPAVYSANSTVAVTLTFSGTGKMASLFIGETIPKGWTVVGAAADYVVDGVLRMAWDAPDIPTSYTYTIKAPSANLADSYVIASSAADTGCFADELMPIAVTDTALLNNNNHYDYHPADCLNKDGKISGLEFLRYAGPVKALVLANEEYTWDGVDVLSIRAKNATRGGGEAADVAISRHVDTTTYEAGDQVTITLSISGADGIVSLFVGETIPEGWSVVGDFADNVKNGVLRMAWDAPNIPETVTYIMQAPAENLSAICKIASSGVDTGCFTDRVLLLDAGETILTHGAASQPTEWPQDMALYAPADGRNFREADSLAVTFSWPSILDAEGYRLVIATYDGEIVFDETLEETSCTVRGLKRGSYIWNVTAVGDDCIAGTSDDFRFAVIPAAPAPIIIGAVADGTAVQLAFDTAEPGYMDGEITYQVIFYSFETQTLTNLTQTTVVADGKAVIDLGVAASNGYLAIRPVTTPESDFTELYIK